MQSLTLLIFASKSMILLEFHLHSESLDFFGFLMFSPGVQLLDSIPGGCGITTYPREWQISTQPTLTWVDQAFFSRQVGRCEDLKFLGVTSAARNIVLHSNLKVLIKSAAKAALTADLSRSL